MSVKSKQAVTAIEAAELFEAIAQGEPNLKLAVPVKVLHGAVGATPVVWVKSIVRGIDWDHGVVMLATDQPVHAAGDAFEAERKAARSAAECIGWVAITLKDSMLTDAQKLATIARHLDRKREREAPPAKKAS